MIGTGPLVRLDLWRVRKVAYRGLGISFEGHSERYIYSGQEERDDRADLLTSKDPGPDILIMAMPALPGAVDTAYIVSSKIETCLSLRACPFSFLYTRL
jgi:hypothetical protein